MKDIKNIALTNFSLRHFRKDGAGTRILDYTPERFAEIINEDIEPFMRDGAFDNSCIVKIVDGYADFCKLIFVKNFTKAKTGVMKINISNVQYLHSDYVARTTEELPVLTRSFKLPSCIKIPKAKYLCIVLYSKEQLLNEYNAQPEEKEPFEFEGKDVDWGIVSIMSCETPEESPIPPITMMRNALGSQEGGSGVLLDREKYLKSVEYWSQYALIS